MLLLILQLDLIKSLEEASSALFQWFDNNLLKNNPGKCHLLISNNESTTVKISEYEIKNSECENLLGVKLDWMLILMTILLIYGKKLVENGMFQSELHYYRISNFSRPLVKSVYHGSKNALFLGPRI